MAIEKYIIDKSDLGALLRGEELTIQPRGNIRGFCVEVAGNLTNGDMIKALFGEPELEGRTGLIYDFKRLNGKRLFSTYFDKEWWNAPYKTGSEEDNGASN